MASYPPTKDARDQNLQVLLTKVNEWGAKEKMRIENETQFLQSVLMGRQKANDPGTQNLEVLLTPSGLLQTSINDFILFGSSPGGGAPGG
jgi:hypothetical protein